MAHTPLTAYYAIMAISLLFVLISLIAISLKEKSWINWYSLTALQNIAMLYLLPALFMLNSGPSGSYFAYVFCFATYACVSLSIALGYCFLRPIKLRARPAVAGGGIRNSPWFLLLAGVILYLPVLYAFPQFILHPREIYANFSAAGYGLNFFGSSMFVTLACITYLFKRRKSLHGGAVFFAISVAVIYLHGSKGQLVVLVFIGILYRVYAGRKRASLMIAVATLGAVVVSTGALFALFGNSTDVFDLFLDMANYSDAGRNAMQVIEDTESSYSWGQLEVEDEFYSRMPRLLAPDKPKAFGQVRLAQRYYPEAFRDSAGTPSFGIGMQYADFGPATIVLLSIGGAFTGWFARSIVVSLAPGATPGRFLLLLFFAGIVVIPLGAGYMLPETVLLAITLDWLQRGSFVLVPFLRPTSVTTPRPAI